MPTTHTVIRVSVVAAPVLLFLYGVLRWIDGRDGDHGPGFAWNLGHALFLAAFVLLGLLAVELRRALPVARARRQLAANSATAAALFGTGCFLWVTLCDLFAELDEAAPLPEPARLLGPPAFQLGVLTLMFLLVTARPRLLPVRSPLLVFTGFLLIAADLDLLPVGTLLLLIGLAPLARISGPAPYAG